MGIDEQIKIMEKELAALTSTVDKMHYLSLFFAPDPQFTQEARDHVCSNMRTTKEPVTCPHP